MATETATFFRTLSRRRYDPSLRNVTGTVRFDINGEGSWWVTVNDGALAVASDGTHADCVYTAAAADFVPIAQGKQNPFSAALQGRVHFTGDPALALIMQRIFG